MNKFTNFILILFTLLFAGVNQAWAYWTTDKDGNAIADNTSVKGYVSNSGDTYYVVDETTEYSISATFSGESHTYTLNGPGENLSFYARRTARTAIGNLTVNDGYSNLYNDNPGYDYGNAKGPYCINLASRNIKFSASGGSYSKKFKNVKVTMASYCTPETSSIAFGSNTYLTSDSKTLKVYWSNTGNKTISKSGDTDRFTVSMSSIPSKAGYYGNTVVTITYKRDAVGSNHSMTLTINGQNIIVTGSTTKGTPTIDCASVSALGLTYGQKLSASTISGANATYKNGSYTGTYSWTRSDASTHTALGCTNYSVTFTPTNTNLNSVNCTIQVPITKVAQTITWSPTNKYLVDSDVQLNATTSGHDASVYYTSSDPTIASIDGTWVRMHKAGDVVITAHADATCNYNAAANVSHTFQFRHRPVLQWNMIGEDDHIYSGDVLANLAYAMYGNNSFNLPYTYSAEPSGILIPTKNNDTLLVNTQLTQEVNCTVTATFAGNETYCAVSGSHTYRIEPKATPLFLLNGENLAETPEKVLTMYIGETANMAFENTDETDGRFTYTGNAQLQYISYAHNSGDHTGVITAEKYGNEHIQFHQTGTTTIFDHTRSVHVYVKKHEVALSTTLDGVTYEVGDAIETALYSLSVQPEAGQPEQNEVTVVSSNEQVLAFENGQWLAKNAGQATLTIAQKNNAYWTGDTVTATITVIKKTPVFTWKLPVTSNFNREYTEPVISTNTDAECAFSYVSANTAAIRYENGALNTYETAANHVAVTVTQAGNYKWNEHTEVFYVNVEKLPNHVQLTINSEAIYNAVNGGTQGDVGFQDGNVIRLGGPDRDIFHAPAYNKDDKFVDIVFEGLPNQLYFDYAVNQNAATGEYWYVKEKATKNSDWSGEIWHSEKEGESYEAVSPIQLNKDTRYVRLCYSGNFAGLVRNLTITELKKIDAPASVDFGSVYAGNAASERTVNVDWYNVKTCTVALSGANAECFELLDESVASTLDNYGTAGIRVHYKHDVIGSHTATLTVTSADSPAKTATVTLTGETKKALQSIIWREDITPLPLDEPYAGAAVATSGLDVTLTAETPGIVCIDGAQVTGVGVGTTRLFAYQAGDAKWEAVNETITVEVTNKRVQHIIWTDKLSNVKREDGKTETMPLTAYSDADAALPITYELDEAAQAFASVNGATLTVTGWGTGYITARQAGSDAYVGVAKTMKVVSRDPNAACEPLVLDEAGEKTLHTIDSKEFTLNGEPRTLAFDAKCDAAAIWGLWIYEDYNGSWHEVTYIERGEMSKNYAHYGPYDLHINTTKIKISADAGSTLTRTFKNVEVTLAKYLRLKENNMNFSNVELGQVMEQEFYLDYSNLSGALEVSLANASEQFTILTETVGEDCGEVNHNAVVRVRFTGHTLGTENNTIILQNKDQSIAVPVSATVVKASQVITWEAAEPMNVQTTEHVVLSAAATSGLPVAFESGDHSVAETYDQGDGTWGLTIYRSGDVTITAMQEGNDRYNAAEAVERTYRISRAVPQITAVPTASPLVLPNTTLSSSVLTGGVASVEGTFAWEDETAHAAVGNHAYTVVFTPVNTDWYSEATCEVMVPVTKAPQSITWNFTDTEMYCNAEHTFDATASSGLKVVYATSDNSIAYVDTDNRLRILQGGVVTITARQEGNETYAAAQEIAKTLTILRETPVVVELPEAASMKIGKLLSDASLTGGRAELDGVEVAGSFAWENGNTRDEQVAGTFPRTIIFTPANENYYNSVSFEMNVTVEKYAPEIAHTLTGSAITYGQPLSESVLSGTLVATDVVKVPNETVEGTYAWRNAAETVNAGTPTMAVARFTPDNTDWYEEVDFTVPVEVAQAAPVLDVTAEDIFVVQTLSQSQLTNNGTPGTCAWDASLNAETNYPEEGEHVLPFVFHSADPNYLDGAGTVALRVYPGCVFIGGSEGGWHNNGNWIKETQPEAGDNVMLKNDVEIPAGAEVTVNAMTIADGVNVRIANGGLLTIGSGNSLPRTMYGNVYVENGGRLHLTEGKLAVNNFTLEARLGNTTNAAASGQVSGAEEMDINGEAYFQMTFDPRGAIDYGWYDFVVPFEVEVTTGVYDANGVQLRHGVDYAVMDYSEAKRAANIKCWTRYSGTMQPGRLYTITFDDVHTDWNTFLFKKKAGAGFNRNNEIYATCSAGDPLDQGWNAFGNSTLQHTEFNVPEGTKIQVYDHSNRKYVVNEANAVTLAVGTSFFMQVASEQTIALSPAVSNHGFLAPARENKTVGEFRLALIQNDAQTASDYLWVSASEEATGDYTIGHDLLKMGTMTDAKTAQLWAEQNEMSLCDIEMPLITGDANCALGLYAPQAARYTLAIEQAPENAALYLTYEGRVIWDLTAGAYAMDLTTGTTEGYGLRIVALKAPDITTGTDTMRAEKKAQKVLMDGMIYIITPEGQMYNVTGKVIK